MAGFGPLRLAAGDLRGVKREVATADDGWHKVFALRSMLLSEDSSEADHRVRRQEPSRSRRAIGESATLSTTTQMAGETDSWATAGGYTCRE